MSTSHTLDIWNAVLTTLQAAQGVGNPLFFVNKIYDGIYPSLHDLPMGSFPAIVMEPDDVDEKFFTTGTPPAVKSDFKIFISCIVKEAKFNKGVSGDDTLLPNRLVGLLEMVDRVKGVLQKDMTLGGVQGLQKLWFPKSTYFYEGYPLRECKMQCVFDSQLTTESHY